MSVVSVSACSLLVVKCRRCLSVFVDCWLSSALVGAQLWKGNVRNSPKTISEPHSLLKTCKMIQHSARSLPMESISLKLKHLSRSLPCKSRHVSTLKPKINELPFCYKPIFLRNGSWAKWWVIASQIQGTRKEKSTNHKGRKYAKNSVHIFISEKSGALLANNFYFMYIYINNIDNCNIQHK